MAGGLTEDDIAYLQKHRIPQFVDALSQAIADRRPTDVPSFMLQFAHMHAQPRSARFMNDLFAQLSSKASDGCITEDDLTACLKDLLPFCDVDNVRKTRYVPSTFGEMMGLSHASEQPSLLGAPPSPRRRLSISVHDDVVAASVGSSLSSKQELFATVLFRIFRIFRPKESKTVFLHSFVPPIALLLDSSLSDRLASMWAVLSSLQAEKGSGVVPQIPASIAQPGPANRTVTGRISPSASVDLSSVQNTASAGASATLDQYLAFFQQAMRAISGLRGLPFTAARWEASAAFLTRQFHAADNDHSGTLEFSEFVSAVESPDHPLYALMEGSSGMGSMAVGVGGGGGGGVPQAPSPGCAPGGQRLSPSAFMT